MKLGIHCKLQHTINMSACITGEKNLTFLHIPKTAGTSMLEWLRINKGNSTVNEWESHPKHSELPQGNYSFTIVRNPWDRMVSAYHYLKNISLPEGSSWLKLNNITEENFPTFNEWIVNLSNFDNPVDYWFRPETEQIEWLDCPVNLVLRFENLAENFSQIQRLYGCFDTLPKLYVTNHSSYKDYYSHNTRTIVEKLSQRDIEIFKYSF